MKLSATKEFYLANRGKTLRVGPRTVTVSSHRTESRGGSWERGFRFYHSEWALLSSSKGQYSMDHGKTWHPSKKAAMRLSKGKLRLTSENHGEFAFEGIQKICRDWDGPGYRWHR